MYVPSAHEEHDRGTLHRLIAAHPLGTLITTSGNELVANHVPFILQPEQGELGTLICHVARANPVWRELSQERNSLVVFQGANTYITPSWYPSKHAHGRVVPTWNYAVVHVRGIPRIIEDRAWLIAQVHALTGIHEAEQPAPWRVTDAPAEFIDRMLQMIVGIEIPIAQLTGKWKVSQNRAHEDKQGVVHGLATRNGTRDAEMASMVERFVE